MTPSTLLPLFSRGTDVTAQLQYFACVFILLLLSVSRKESYERRAQILFRYISRVKQSVWHIVGTQWISIKFMSEIQEKADLQTQLGSRHND